MHKLTVEFNCPLSMEKKAVYILNLIASGTGIAFIRSENEADIVYGESDDKRALVIPCKNYDDLNENNTINSWRFSDDKYNLLLPEFISLNSVRLDLRRLDFNLFDIMFEFFKNGLSKPDSPKWLNNGNANIVRPVFDNYIEFFVDFLKANRKIPSDFKRISPWPGKAPFALGISHDIDIFSRKVAGSLVMLAKSLFSDEIAGGVKGSLIGLFDTIMSRLSGKPNPYRRISGWFDIDSSATYFIYAGNRRSLKDPTYNHAEVLQALSKSKNCEIEIGLHNGIDTWNKREELDHSRQKLTRITGDNIYGIRPHYLDCRFPDFWKNAAGFSYSSSAGSDKIPGFTCGINQPFFGFDFEPGDALDILELPISLMDCALFSFEDKDVRERIIDEIIEECRLNHGLMVIDWHTRTSYKPDFPDWFETYGLILEKARAAGAYITSLNKINRCWRNHCESVFLS